MVGMVANYTWLRLTSSYNKEVLNKRELLKNLFTYMPVLIPILKRAGFPLKDNKPFIHLGQTYTDLVRQLFFLYFSHYTFTAL